MQLPLCLALSLVLVVQTVGNILNAAEPPAAAPAGKSTAPIDDTDAIRVMSFNIRFNNPADGKSAWPHRKEKAASMIRLHRADLVGLQEAQPPQIRELRELLPEWSWTGLRGRAGTGDADECVPIMYRTARFELLDEGSFWLSETPAVPASKGWDAAITRMTNWAKLRDRRTGKELLLFNTHFDHVGKTARTESAKLMMSQVTEIAKSLPAIVIGDMNSRDTSEAYAVFTGKQHTAAGDSSAEAKAAEVKLQDAMHTSLRPHHGPTATFNGFGPLQAENRIDYIFITPTVQVLQHDVLSDQWDLGRWPSDHLPVLAEVLLQ